MGQVFHGSARTTEAVRRTIQNRQESMRALARRYGINPKTVRKWKCRCSTVDAPMGPKIPSTPSSPRRLPLCHASHYPASNTLVAPPLSAAPGCPKSKAKKHQEKIQDLPDRLLPHRHRRGPDRRRQTLPLRRHRSHFEACLCKLRLAGVESTRAAPRSAVSQRQDLRIKPISSRPGFITELHRFVTTGEFPNEFGDRIGVASISP